MSPNTSETGYEVLATACHNERCPTLYRDPATGRIGVQGYVTTAAGERREHISWMDPEAWDALRVAGV